MPEFPRTHLAELFGDAMAAGADQANGWAPGFRRMLRNQICLWNCMPLDSGSGTDLPTFHEPLNLRDGTNGGIYQWAVVSNYVGVSPTASVQYAWLKPTASPRLTMFCVIPDSLAVGNFGFIDSDSDTCNGAYLRVSGSRGNVYAVCRQGGAETEVSCGLVSASPEWWEIFSPDGGVSWIFARNDLPVACIITNVPTAGTALWTGGRRGPTVPGNCQFMMISADRQ